MENNTGIMSYQFLIEMEAEHQKINEMIMAPKFAKLLKESVDEVDYNIHKTKTNELITEFVDKAFSNTVKVLDTITENIDRIDYNDRLGFICESKVKSLTEFDRDIVLAECDMQDTLSNHKFDITLDIDCVNEGLTKVLESDIKTKEDYNKVVKPFIKLVSECSERLDKIDIGNIEKSDVSVMEVSKVLHKLKNAKLSKEKDKSKLAEIKDKMLKNKDKAKKNAAKVKEAVYAGTAYLMKANSILERVITVSHENATNIVLEFINYEVSEEATVQFESSISRFIYQNNLEDDDL